MTEPTVHYAPDTSGHLVGDMRIACKTLHWGVVSDDLAKVTCGECLATHLDVILARLAEVDERMTPEYIAGRFGDLLRRIGEQPAPVVPADAWIERPDMMRFGHCPHDESALGIADGAKIPHADLAEAATPVLICERAGHIIAVYEPGSAGSYSAENMTGFVAADPDPGGGDG